MENNAWNDDAREESREELFARLDGLTVEQLQATGATKWARQDGAIGAFIAETDFGSAPQVLNAVHAEVAAQRFGYLPPQLIKNMQQAVADEYARSSGWQILPERIRPMPDVISAYRAALQYFSGTHPTSEAGRETTDGANRTNTEPIKIIVPTPSYMPFLLAAQVLGAPADVPPSYAAEKTELHRACPAPAPCPPVEIHQAPMRFNPETHRYEHDLDTIRAGFEAGAILLVLCNPHNPTGRVFDRNELLELAEVVAEYNGRVFSDEIWMPLRFDDHPHIPYASLNATTAAHTITATAASKAFNTPGLKTAQLILSNDDDAAVWSQVGFFPEHGASNLGVVAATAAFNHGRPWLEHILAYLKRNRDTLTRFFTEKLPDAGITAPEGTYVAWIDVSAYNLGPEPAEFLAEHAGVACTEGSASGEVGAGHIRLIFAMPHPILLQALEKIYAVLHPHRPQ